MSLGEFVAQFKFTVLLMANGPLRITTGLYEQELYQSEHQVEDADLKVKQDRWATASCGATLGLWENPWFSSATLDL